jgi:hypothetical protein
MGRLRRNLRLVDKRCLRVEVKLRLSRTARVAGATAIPSRLLVSPDFATAARSHATPDGCGKLHTESGFLHVFRDSIVNRRSWPVY